MIKTTPCYAVVQKLRVLVVVCLDLALVNLLVGVSLIYLRCFEPRYGC